MTDKLNEKISALMDHQLGAPEADELTAHMAHDPSLRYCWARYHLIGDALRNNGRNNLPDTIKHDLAARVAKIIETEPPLPVSLDTYRHSPGYIRGKAATFFKPAVGMAIAASVALVAVVSFNMTGGINHPTGQQLVMAPLQNSASMMPAQPIPPSVMASASVAPQMPAEAVVHITGPELANNPRLASYLEDHNKYSNATVVQGQMLPYVRIVGYVPKQQ